MNTTMEAVREARQRAMDYAHTWRRDALRFRDERWKQLNRLGEAGFVWMVPSRWFLRFKYHATITEDPFILTKARGGGVYIGDIPETVLERMELALSLGIKALTIHSNEELEVTPERTVDPVVLGWLCKPHIYWEEERAPYLGNGWPGAVFVISVWDNDTELEL